jgi:aconitate hydratase
VSFDVNPTSRRMLRDLVSAGHVGALLAAGARIHQAGCNGCIGMGQAPATNRISVRTVPRNFPGRSGTREDQVYLCSPETAAASALAGVIADPRDFAREQGLDHPRCAEPENPARDGELLVPPLPPEEARGVELVKGPGIASLPELERFDVAAPLPVLLKLGDDVSTDEILPAGARVLPVRSDIARIAEFSFEPLDPTYVERARRAQGGHALVAGRNYGQGSSREHAAYAPRTLGLRAVIARSYARIHRENLINYGVAPLLFADEAGYGAVAQGDVLVLPGVDDLLARDGVFELENRTRGAGVRVRHDLSPREMEVLRAPGLIRWARERLLAG